MKLPLLVLPILLLPTAAAQTPLADDAPVARIGDVTLTRGQFEDWLFEREGRTLVRDYAGDALVLDEARRRGLLPGEEQVAAAFDDEVRQIVDVMHEGDEEAWTGDLKKRGFTAESWRRERLPTLRVELATRNLVLADRQVTEAQLQQRFKEIYGGGGENRSLQVLFFSAWRDRQGVENPDLDKLRAAARARAEAARARLLAGEALETLVAESDRVASDFVLKGRVHSYRKNLLGQEVDRAVEQLDHAGDLSPPVDVWDGCYLVRLESLEMVTFESARADLESELRSAQPTSAEILAVRMPLMDRVQVEEW